MSDKKTVIIDEEEFIRVSIPLPKRFVEFLREFGEWIGYRKEELDEFVGEVITESVEAYIYGRLDDMGHIAPLKAQQFRRKFNL